MSFLWKVVVVLIAILSLYFVFSPYQNCVKGLLSEGPTSIEDQSQGKGNSGEEIQNSECLKINDEDSTLNKSLKVIASYLLDVKSNLSNLFGSEDMGFTKSDVNTMLRQLAKGDGSAFNKNPKVKEKIQQYQDSKLVDSPEAAQKLLIDSLRLFIESQYKNPKLLLKNLDTNQDRIKLYDKEKLGHGIPSPSPHKQSS